MCCCLTWTAVLGFGIWALMYLRLPPVIVMRVWFGFTLVMCLLVSSLNAYVLDAFKYAGMTSDNTKKLVAGNCSFFYWLFVFLNPQIRIHMDETKMRFADIELDSITCINHTSMLDVFLFLFCSPWHYIIVAKTMMKDALRKIPIFGGVFDRVGHFPVHFKSGADNDFSVDKEKQDAVMKAVNEHIKKGLPLCIFPEGAVNATPQTMKPFRYGSFKMMAENKMKIYYFVTVGAEVAWPAAEALGGFPTDIFATMGKIEVDYSTEEFSVIAEKARSIMQAEVDKLYAIRAKVIGEAPAVSAPKPKDQ